MDADNFLIELAMTSLFFLDNFKLIFNLILFELYPDNCSPEENCPPVRAGVLVKIRVR